MIETKLVGTWEGTLALPEGVSCIESCERTMTFKRDHTFKTSDACPGYEGTWSIRPGNAIELQRSSKDYADETGTTSCLSGSTFKPDSAELTEKGLEVPFDDAVMILLTKRPPN